MELEGQVIVIQTKQAVINFIHWLIFNFCFWLGSFWKYGLRNEGFKNKSTAFYNPCCFWPLKYKNWSKKNYNISHFSFSIRNYSINNWLYFLFKTNRSGRSFEFKSYVTVYKYDQAFLNLMFCFWRYCTSNICNFYWWDFFNIYLTTNHVFKCMPN